MRTPQTLVHWWGSRRVPPFASPATGPRFALVLAGIWIFALVTASIMLSTLEPRLATTLFAHPTGVAGPFALCVVVSPTEGEPPADYEIEVFDVTSQPVLAAPHDIRPNLPPPVARAQAPARRRACVTLDATGPARYAVRVRGGGALDYAEFAAPPSEAAAPVWVPASRAFTVAGVAAFAGVPPPMVPATAAQIVFASGDPIAGLENRLWLVTPTPAAAPFSLPLENLEPLPPPAPPPPVGDCPWGSAANPASAPALSWYQATLPAKHARGLVMLSARSGQAPDPLRNPSGVAMTVVLAREPNVKPRLEVHLTTRETGPYALDLWAGERWLAATEITPVNGIATFVWDDPRLVASAVAAGRACVVAAKNFRFPGRHRARACVRTAPPAAAPEPLCAWYPEAGGGAGPPLFAGPPGWVAQALAALPAVARAAAIMARYDTLSARPPMILSTVELQRARVDVYRQGWRGVLWWLLAVTFAVAAVLIGWIIIGNLARTRASALLVHEGLTSDEAQGFQARFAVLMGVLFALVPASLMALILYMLRVMWWGV